MSLNPISLPSSGSPHIDRRSFVKALSAASAGLALSSSPLRGAVTGTDKRVRYAIVGTGSRHFMYQDAIEQSYQEHAELVALCDKNPGRVEVSRQRSKENKAKPPAGYVSADFKKMIAETKPDCVIVTTVDGFHHDYIISAMEQGCDVISEKPMTNTAEKVQQIFDAKKRTGRNLRVTFNYRYSPPRTQVKDILMSGAIGDILSVDFHWLLNTQHGADYFRRWHSQKEMSGGLMVHKATHHFDLVNWWLGAVPVSVAATGKREFYTPKMATRLGLESFHERCLTCPEKDKCTFHLDLTKNEKLKALYLDQEKYDGYLRDRCVWRPDISIEDTMNVLVRYDNDVTMSYSLNAFNAWEGYMIAFNGTKGRLEHSITEGVSEKESDSVTGPKKSDRVSTRVIPLRQPAREYEPWTGTGGHGGGDKVMLDEIFLPNAPKDKYLRASDERGGAASCLVGIAANRCFETGKVVEIAELVPGLARPDFAPMPSHDAPVPMPPRASAS